MVELAIISDTHIPSRADEIPDWVADRVRMADHTIHAGDFDGTGAYETVVDLADGNLTAVLGNMDPVSLDAPRVATAELGGVTFVVTHGTGSLEGYRERVAKTVRDEVDESAIGVSGHTHEVLDEEVEGVRILNPGSATAASPAERETMMSVEVVDGEIELTLYEDGEEVGEE